MRALALLMLALTACSPSFDSPATAADASSISAAEPGQPAPDFTLSGVDGTPFTLSAQRGNTVVLEWFNPDCPFVKHAYTEGPLKSLASTWTGKGIVWVAINSNKPGSQGAGAERNKAARQEYSMPIPVLLDESGKVGRMYGAKTTPQIVVIDKDGKLVYTGGLDNAPLGKVEGDKHRIFADEVLTGVTTTGAAPFSKQKPYGCSVKY